MLIDDITIKIKAGDGGKGAVAFNKNLMELGPTGAKGGNGGSVYFKGVSDLGALRQFRFKKTAEAKNGEDGKSQFRDGTNSEDLILKVPVGTVIHNRETGVTVEITKINETLLLAKSGRGGKGNFHFRSPRNTTPTEFEEGTKGEKATLRLELKLIADVGLIGLPNAGKSTLLNELTSAKAKVANYPFTTLEPNLGVFYGGLVIADIPGLIEGASSGKGLGIKFLRHIERTRVLFHLASSESKTLIKDYKTIRNELKQYNPELLKKTEFVLLTKSDEIPEKDLKKKLTSLKKYNKNTFSLSILNEMELKKIKTILTKLAEEKTSSPTL